MTMPQLVAGNWKMNGLLAAKGEVAALVSVIGWIGSGNADRIGWRWSKVETLTRNGACR